MTNSKRIEILISGLVFAAGIAPVLLLLNHFDRSDLMIPTMASAATIAATIKVCSEFHKRTWFWITMTAIGILHVLLILYFPWRAGWIPAPLTILVCIADFVVILGFVYIIEKLMNNLKGENSGEQS